MHEPDNNFQRVLFFTPAYLSRSGLALHCDIGGGLN